MPNDDTTINTGVKNLKFLTELEKTIFSLTEENFQASVKKILGFFDTNFPDTFNIIISNIIYNAFASRKLVFDVCLNFINTLQMNEEEINQNIVKLISIFIKRISSINTQESCYLMEKLIDQNLIDKNITKNISSRYFAHYKTEKENQNHIAYGNDPIERYYRDHYEELSKNDWELHKKYIKEGANPNEIAKIIRNDEIEKLQEISSQTNFNFNQHIRPSLYERCSFVNQDYPYVTLIDYAAFFSSIQCFKYLLMNGANVENTGKYAVAGGNEEIIHLCEQNHSSFYKAYETAIQFHQNDIFKYLYENNLEKTQSIPEMSEDKTYDLVSFCIKKDNYEILAFLEEKGINVNACYINESARNGNLFLLKYFLQNNQIPNNILPFASKSGSIELVKYVLDQKGIDVNAKVIHLNNFIYVLIILDMFQ